MINDTLMFFYFRFNVTNISVFNLLSFNISSWIRAVFFFLTNFSDVMPWHGSFFTVHDIKIYNPSKNISFLHYRMGSTKISINIIQVLDLSGLSIGSKALMHPLLWFLYDSSLPKLFGRWSWNPTQREVLWLTWLL